MKAYEEDYLIALANAHESKKSFHMVEALIKEHFAMIRHMKETSLYDVYTYEERVAQPLDILTYDNEKLRSEVNDLRKRLGLGKKYKD